MQRKWDSEDNERQRKCIDEIITRVEEIDGEAVGEIAAQDIIDIVTENLAPEIYNRGLNDAKRVLSEKIEDISVEVDSLSVRD